MRSKGWLEAKLLETSHRPEDKEGKKSAKMAGKSKHVLLSTDTNQSLVMRRIFYRLQFQQTDTVNIRDQEILFGEKSGW